MNIFETNLFPYFEGDAIKNNDISVVMSDVKSEQLPDHKGNKVAKFTLGMRGSKKRLVLNKTNAKRIALIYGAETSNWSGKEITLTTEIVQAFGKTHNAVRVKLTDKQNQNIFETPEIDDAAGVPIVEDIEWFPSVVDFYATLLKDFSKGKFIADKATMNSILKNECGMQSLKTNTGASGSAWVVNASELYNCIAKAISNIPMSEAMAIEASLFPDTESAE